MIRLNLARIERGFTRAFAETGQDLSQAIQEDFEHPIWQWRRATKRKSGEIAGSPRNIVDTGALRDSQVLDIARVGEIQIRWTAPYAARVFLGDGRSAPRNLPIVVLHEFRFAEKFATRAKGVI